MVIVAGGCSMLLMAPLFAASMTEPATLASFFGGLVLCYALVSIGAFASNHVAASLNLTDYRADDRAELRSESFNNNCAYFRIRKSNVETLKSPQICG